MIRKWGPVKNEAIKAAGELGHKLGRFDGRNRDVKTAMCEQCFGCCWIAFSPTRGYGAGGRLLKYECGTKEAAGVR